MDTGPAADGRWTNSFQPATWILMCCGEGTRGLRCGCANRNALTQMRIMHVLNHVDEAGNGIVNAAVDLACHQAAAGHGVWVISAGGAYESLLSDFAITHCFLDQRR